MTIPSFADERAPRPRVDGCVSCAEKPGIGYFPHSRPRSTTPRGVGPEPDSLPPARHAYAVLHHRQQRRRQHTVAPARSPHGTVERQLAAEPHGSTRASPTAPPAAAVARPVRVAAAAAAAFAAAAAAAAGRRRRRARVQDERVRTGARRRPAGGRKPVGRPARGVVSAVRVQPRAPRRLRVVHVRNQDVRVQVL